MLKELLADKFIDDTYATVVLVECGSTFTQGSCRLLA